LRCEAPTVQSDGRWHGYRLAGHGTRTGPWHPAPLERGMTSSHSHRYFLHIGAVGDDRLASDEGQAFLEWVDAKGDAIRCAVYDWYAHEYPLNRRSMVAEDELTVIESVVDTHHPGIAALLQALNLDPDAVAQIAVMDRTRVLCVVIPDDEESYVLFDCDVSELRSQAPRLANHAAWVRMYPSALRQWDDVEPV
jgi:hypothetical protein